MQAVAQVTSASRLRLSVCCDRVASLFRPLMSARLTLLAGLYCNWLKRLEKPHTAPAQPQATSLLAEEEKRGCRSKLEVIDSAILVVERSCDSSLSSRWAFMWKFVVQV